MEDFRFNTSSKRPFRSLSSYRPSVFSYSNFSCVYSFPFVYIVACLSQLEFTLECLGGGPNTKTHTQKWTFNETQTKKYKKMGQKSIRIIGDKTLWLLFCVSYVLGVSMSSWCLNRRMSKTRLYVQRIGNKWILYIV